jgi:hypothetical protein
MDTVKEFKEKKYTVVRSAISEEMIEFISQYTLFDEIQNPLVGDPQVPRAHSKYGDPAMETLLLMLQPLMEKHTELKLHPTYSYYRIYRNGDDLKKHSDRESCEISATLSFRYSYESDPWAIFMDGSPIYLEPGDLAIYRGCEVEHWREELKCNPNDWHVQGFFHYVDQDGPVSEFKFDRREFIGQPLKRNKKYIHYLR